MGGGRGRDKEMKGGSPQQEKEWHAALAGKGKKR
jgi:hypothetical protein